MFREFTKPAFSIVLLVLEACMHNTNTHAHTYTKLTLAPSQLALGDKNDMHKSNTVSLSLFFTLFHFDTHTHIMFMA